MTGTTYIRLSVSVGELLLQLEPHEGEPATEAEGLDPDEWLSFGMTTFCLAQALSSGYPPQYLDTLLAHHRAVEIEPTGSWREFGLYLKHCGTWANLHHAYLVWLAFQLDAYIVTRSPDTYLAGDKNAPILLLEEPFN